MMPLFHLCLLSLWFLTARAQVPADAPPAQVVKDHASQVVMHPHSSNCELACANIALKLSDKLYYKREGSFAMWDVQQDEVTPACRVTPSNPEDVALVLGILVKESCPFAIKSGGHSRFANSSNSNGGVTIDLKDINEVDIAKDGKTVRLGSGANWHEVYSTLEKQNLLVLGGRVADVGVGGLLLGGGISFMSPKYGWAMDSVSAFELVLPNSTIVTVTEASSPDLYFALRGGGKNFGVVTHFTLDTYKQGLFMGGSQTFSGDDKIDAVLDGVQRFTENTEQTDAASYTAFCYFKEYDIFLAVVQQVHMEPKMDPEIFSDFTKLEPASSGLRIDSMSNLTLEIQNTSPYGQRHIYSTMTYRPSRELNGKMFSILQEEVESVKAIENVVPCMIFQPLYKTAIKHMKKRGGNALGIHEEGPLAIMSTAMAWKNPADDTPMYQFNNRFMERTKREAENMGLHHPFLYQNYASQDQDVFASYGPVELARLKRIQREVDPEGIFAKGGLCDGYFNLHEKKTGDATRNTGTEESPKVRDEL